MTILPNGVEMVSCREPIICLLSNSSPFRTKSVKAIFCPEPICMVNSADSFSNNPFIEAVAGKVGP